MRILRLDVRCPRCGARPRIRIPEDERDACSAVEPTRLKLTYGCHRRACDEFYPITAGDYSRAA